jgi:thioredoxin:protein disulfide reductase
VAISLGYENVYRDPLGYQEWEDKGHPVASSLPEHAPDLADVPFMPEAPGPLYGWAMVWTLLGIFLGGMALNLTPCVYPLIPITVSYFAGRQAQGRAGLVAHGLLYIGGLALTNSALGTAAALTGGLMGGLLQNPLVLSGIALVLVAFAMSLFGFWELRMPAALTRAASKSRAGYVGTLFMGLTLGVVAAPCIGPFVLGLLTWVAAMGSPWIGFLVFFTLSLGLGIPLFVLAVFSGTLQRLPRSGEWMIWVRKLMGWVLVGMAAYFIRPLLGEPWGLFLMAGVALAAAVHLAWVDRSTASFRSFPWIKNGVGMAGLLLAVLLVGSWAMRGTGVDWQPYSDALLEQAREQGKPVIIDFYATWCAPCRELESVTLHHPEVVERARDMVMIKVDVTRGGNPLHEHLLRYHRVRGVPTIIFIDAQGQERSELRLVDFLAPEDFVKLMDQLSGQSENPIQEE